MSRTHLLGHSSRSLGLVALASAVWLASLGIARAQFVTQQVGGVSIDANGIVQKVRVDEVGELLKVRTAALQPVGDDLQKAGLRKVSLRQLEAAIAEHHKNGTPLTDDMIYLAGLQRIQYVFVFPEQNDIVLAGPGEGWKLSADGEIVGVTTNRPVLLLDDLLVALRSTEALRQTGISCSIDPTPEGLARFQQLMKTMNAAPDDPAPLMAAVEQAMGPQTITIKGVPEASHFARVLVAADYRMKRLAMAFDEPPIAGMPNYLQMVKAGRGGASNAMPRWWLAPDYDALVTDGNGLAWEFQKAGVKCLTEDSVLGSGGQLQRTAKKSPLAEKWADNMTAHYDELAEHESIFGQLRNCMDLAVFAALVTHHNLPGKCGWDMALFLDPDFKAKRYNAPRSVHTLASYVQQRRGLVISASGGVAIDPWPLLDKNATKPELAATREQAAARTSNWWWD